jgi:CBS domain-containing protein
MPEDGTLFLPVRNFCQRQLITCPGDTPLVEAATTMRARDISSMIVCTEGEPVGIFTDRDLRNKVSARGIDPHTLLASSIMSTPLIVVREDDFLFEALYRMSRNGIHRVGIVDAEGRLTGIVTDSDILNLQSRSPQKLLRDIAEAASTSDLARLHGEIQQLVLHMVASGVATRNLVRMIAHLNDRLHIRLIEILRTEKFPDLTERFAFVVLGSEGRREQTLSTDQDNALIYADDLSAAELTQLEAFSHALIEALIGIGVPPCPGGIMARNTFWRRSLTEWAQVVDDWLSTPTPQNILNGSMFFDLRTLYGDRGFERALKASVSDHLNQDAVFLAHTGANVLRFQPPLGWLGGIKTERHGEQRGKLEIKKAGIFAITEGIKVLALEAGILEGGTRERLQGLVAAQVLETAQAQDLEASFDFLVFLRLRCQVRALREGEALSNYLTMSDLNSMERGRLKLALQEVQTFQTFLKRHFQLDLITR